MIEIFHPYQKTFYKKTFRLYQKNRLLLKHLHQEKLVFLSEESISALRNKLPTIAPLPSGPSVDNFSRPITEITDEKNNTISITPKKPVFPSIGQRQLSQQLQKVFPHVNSTVEKTSETFKERRKNINELIEKLGRSDESDDQVTFEFDFFTGGVNPKFNSFVKRYGLTNENMQFV